MAYVKFAEALAGDVGLGYGEAPAHQFVAGPLPRLHIHVEFFAKDDAHQIPVGYVGNDKQFVPLSKN